MNTSDKFRSESNNSNRNAVIKVDAKIDRLDEKTDDVKVIVKELRDDNSKRREEETITQNSKYSSFTIYSS